jgi:hypothetical protein
MQGNQLTGTIGTEVGVMTVLENMDLSANSFTGTIPTELGNLTLLEGK